MNTVVVGLEWEVTKQIHAFQNTYVEIEISMCACAYMLECGIMAFPPPKSSHSNAANLWMCYLQGKKDFAGVIVKCFKMQRSSWVIGVGCHGYTGRPEGQSQTWRWTSETEVRQRDTES